MDTHSKDISKLISQLLSILVLIYLICIPLGRIKKDSKFEPVDVSVLMVLLIVNSNIIEKVKIFKLGKDGFEATINQAKEEVKKDIEDQNTIDFEAMRRMDLQLSDATPLSDSNDLRKNILEASPIAVEYIYQRAKDVRHDLVKENRQRKSQGKPIIKGMLERTIPLFRALTESKYGIEFHRYHAQLGYALKDYALEDKDHPKTSELRDARESLDKAIELWRKQHPDSTSLPPLYCFNWAECDAELLLEKSLLTSQEIQLRIKSAGFCNAIYGDNFKQIECILGKKYEISIPIASDDPNVFCRNSNTLLG